MYRPVLFLLVVLVAQNAFAEDPPRLSRGSGVIHGAPLMAGKAGGDTINLMAAHDDPTNGPGEPLYYGDFQNAGGIEDWNGWTSLDATLPTITRWQVSNYGQADPANLAAWCGDINIPSCDDSLDPVGGYGNSWHEILAFRATVPNPSAPSTVHVTGTLDQDTEPGYDYTYLSYQYEGEMIGNISSWDGKQVVDVSGSVIFGPGQYVDGTDIRILFRFKSDGGWSDEDCQWPTGGACRLDDLSVEIINGDWTEVFFTDFQDSTFGHWTPETISGVGDFAKIWTGLMDLDPCADNFTPQVAFIDDGEVVPGTGGTQCVTWCYGPDGYIVNFQGGLMGPDHHIRNNIISPVMNLPGPDYRGLTYAFDVYRHETLGPDSPGIFYVWGVRSFDTDEPGAITDQPWRDRNFVYYGGPDYHRNIYQVSDLLVPGADQVQVMLGVYELGYVWGWYGVDGTPAPYFDDVTVKVYPHAGPLMTTREIDLAQDNFPEAGVFDPGNLGALHVRFDMANNISLATHQRNDPGDSLSIQSDHWYFGTTLTDPPEMHIRVKTNPLFDAYRGEEPYEMDVTGRIDSRSCFPGDVWYFDLPDSAFLFPGDVVHYYFTATEDLGGGQTHASIMPADTTGFSTGFGHPLGYDPAFTMRALPTLESDGVGGFEAPDILVWDDTGDPGAMVGMYSALTQKVGQIGDDYDVYRTQGASSGVGNGLGGRATAALLGLYDLIVYCSGDQTLSTITRPDFQKDPGDDLGVLTAWLELGDKGLFLSGDNLVADLTSSQMSEGNAFANDFLGVDLVDRDLRPRIGGQIAPVVMAIPGNPVIASQDSWLAYGGCPEINTFDAVETLGNAERLAEFSDIHRITGIYWYAAATLNHPAAAPTSRVISMPYDFGAIRDDEGGSYPYPDRSHLLLEILDYLGLPPGPPWPDPVPAPLPLAPFSVQQHPNPFNPVTKLSITMPRAGTLTVKVYDLRGQLVRNLYEGEAPGGPRTLTWDGTDQNGAAVSSGVYFYEARTGGEVKVGKMALVK